MAGSAENKLRELVANYVPFVRTGNLLTVSGQLCFDSDGKLVAKGQLGGAVSIEDGQKAARACAINLLAQVKIALGDLDKVVRVVRPFITFGPSPKPAAELIKPPSRLRSDGCGVRRQGQARALDGRRGGAAGRGGPSRWKACSRCPDPAAAP
jgi:hypothetical protein